LNLGPSLCFSGLYSFAPAILGELMALVALALIEDILKVVLLATDLADAPKMHETRAINAISVWSVGVFMVLVPHDFSTAYAFWRVII
jgi:hypothetical protein